MTARDIQIGTVSLSLLDVFPEWDLADCDRVAAVLVDEAERVEFELSVQADLDRLPVVA